MADFGDAGTGRLATIRGRDLWGTERLRFEKSDLSDFIFKVSSGIITVSSVFVHRFQS